MTRLFPARTVQAIAIILLSTASLASADSIMRPGLTMGMPEGYGRTPGFYVASIFDAGVRTTDPSVTTQGVAMPIFFTWATPWEVAKTQISIKAAPLVAVGLDAPNLGTFRPYNPYASVWFSWFLGNGFNLSIGEGAHIGLDNDLTNPIGRSFTAFQQNVALSWVKNNWNVTGNGFYTTGRTSDTGSQPETFNLDFTATKRRARKEFGIVGYGVWDLDSPAVGYLPDGQKQSEVAIGGLWGYFIGNLVAVQARVTTDLYQKNYGGRETRFAVTAMFPLWTPAAPRPRNAPQPTR